MARIRTIKPDFWLDEDLAELPAETRLLAIGLLNHSDDEGYFRANPKIVKAAVFPFTEDSVSIHGMLKQLEKVGYVRLGTGSDGKAYGQVTNFSKHQKVNRPNESKIKELEPFTEHSVSDQGNSSEGSLPEGKGTGNREQGREVERAKRKHKFLPELDFSKWPELPSEQIWKDFKSHRNKKRATITQTVIDQMGKELSEAFLDGHSVDHCIAVQLEAGWQGFKFDWFKNRESSNATGNGNYQQAINPADEALYRKYPHLRPQ